MGAPSALIKAAAPYLTPQWSSTNQHFKMTSFVNISILLGFLPFALGIVNFCAHKKVTHDESMESCRHVTLESQGVNTDERKVSGAAIVCHIVNEVESEGCTFGFGFGIGRARDDQSPTVWAKDSCSGTFKVCYVEGACETITLSSTATINGTFSVDGEIYDMSVMRQHWSASGTTCAEYGQDWSFGYNTTTATVRNGCSREHFDAEHYSIWRSDYKFNSELTMVFMSCNLVGGMFQRLEKMKKNAFASAILFGENNNSSISGIWVWKGQEL